MPRVLHIVNKWCQGGVEQFVAGLVEGCDDSRIRQSILSVCTTVDTDAGCPTYGPLCEGEGMTPMLLGAAKLGRFLDMHPFDVIHVHTQNSSGFLYARVAARHGVPHRIIHSHSSSLGTGAGPAKHAAQRFFRATCGGSETMRLACSRMAGEHLFPGRDFRVIPNGIDIERFRFDPGARREIREFVGIGDGLLIGCVGSLLPVKNHMRAISVFDKFHVSHQNSKLLILGEGELRGKLEEEVKRRRLTNSVLLPGFVGDTNRWYNAMDILLFPSIYEGLPITLVEAQCNGLPVVCSDSVTPEVALLPSFVRLPLSVPDAEWAKMLAYSQRDVTDVPSEIVLQKGYDRQSTIEGLLEIYRKYDLEN